MSSFCLICGPHILKVLAAEFPNTLVKVNAPELPIASSSKVTARVHHQDVVVDQQIAFVPDMVEGDSPVMQ